MEYLLILISLSFTVSGQILQKIGVEKALTIPGNTPYLLRIIRQREIWWAAASLVIGAMVWLLVLQRMDVSKAFPLLSLDFVLVILVSRYYLQETVSCSRWLGTALISLGILLVSIA